MISKLNNLGKSKILILAGSVQIITFFVFFYLMVPIYGTIGCSVSVLAAYVSSSLVLIILTERSSIRYIAYACIAVLAGFFVGQLAGIIVGHEHPILIVILSVVVSTIVILTSKNMTVKETGFLLKSMLHKK
jgi:hypothetical protein